MGKKYIFLSFIKWNYLLQNKRCCECVFNWLAKLKIHIIKLIVNLEVVFLYYWNMYKQDEHQPKYRITFKVIFGL